MAGGRPTKYEPEWMIDKVLELMAEGASKHEVAGTLGITFETLNQWKDDENKQEFSEAIKKGQALSQSWWEREGRISLRDGQFNGTLWYMNMKNRFRWADRQEQTMDVNGTVSISDLIIAGRKRTEPVND